MANGTAVWGAFPRRLDGRFENVRMGIWVKGYIGSFYNLYFKKLEKKCDSLCSFFFCIYLFGGDVIGHVDIHAQSSTHLTINVG